MLHFDRNNPGKTPYNKVSSGRREPVVVMNRAAAAIQHQLVFNPGGHVLGAVEVIPIYWGHFWTNGTGLQLTGQVNNFFDFILSSPFMDLLSEYSTPTIRIGHGHRRPSLTFTDKEPGVMTPNGREVSDNQLQQQLTDLIATGRVPARNANTLYFLFLPKDVVSTDDTDRSCTFNTGYCGYHNHINQQIFYAVVPFPACQGCSFGSVLDSLTKISSHELAEAVTDPALNAWTDPNDMSEIGDICNDQTARLGGFVIQPEWSNRQNACVIRPQQV